MAKLVSYNCSNCGAVLNVEQGHKIFDCPFCGADFDYYYFYRKDLLKQADNCLRRMDFKEAKIRFEEILEHDPQEFLALRGLVLCEGGIISLKNLTSPEKLRGCQFTKVRLALNNVLESAREEDKEYFRKLDEMMELAKEYVKLKDERDNLSTDSNAEFKQIVKIDNDVEKTKHVIGSILLAIGMIIMLPFAGEDTTLEDWKNAGMLALAVIGTGIVIGVLVALGRFAFFVALGIVLLILGFIALARHLEDKAKAPHRIKMRENQGTIGTLSTRLSEIETAYEKDYAELQKMVPDDRKREKPDIKTLQELATTEEEKQLVCSKCGGHLSLDRERRLYECHSCGVAYSSVLLSDADSLKNAMHCLSQKDFKEADELFVMELMLDPQNFTALRGRVLCAGRWRNVRDIKLNDAVSSYARIRYKAARVMVEEVITRASDEDKEYFIKFRELVGVLEHYSRMQKMNKKATNGTSEDGVTFLRGDMNTDIIHEQYYKIMKELMVRR